MLDHVAEELELIAIQYGDRAPRAEKEADRRRCPGDATVDPKHPFLTSILWILNDSTPTDDVRMGLTPSLDLPLVYRLPFPSPFFYSVILFYPS
jgi:hypothetical protein